MENRNCGGTRTGKTDETIKKVLVVKTSSLGDIVHTFPAVHAIRSLLPNVQIDWLAIPSLHSIIQLHPDVSEVLCYARQSFGNVFKMAPAACRLVKDIREQQYDIVFDFQGLLRTAFFVEFSNIPRRIGFASPRESLAKYGYNETYKIPEQYVHAVEKNCWLVNAALKSANPILTDYPPFHLNSVDQLKVQSLIKSSETKVIGILPATRWESKQFSTSFFSHIIRQVAIQCPNVVFLLMGSVVDQKSADQIVNECPTVNFLSIVGKTSVSELTAFIQRCSCVLTNDSGPMHIAAALNIPVFALFSSTDAKKTGPYGNGHHVYSVDMDCAPCFKRVCPKSSSNECQKTINTDLIISDIIQQMEVNK